MMTPLLWRTLLARLTSSNRRVSRQRDTISQFRYVTLQPKA